MPFYAVVSDFRPGMPQTVLPGGFHPRGIACHTTEGGEGEAGALGTIEFLLAHPERSASYHEIWYAKGDGFEARGIVRPDRAAHSMNPAQPPWVPKERVRRILGDKWFDPNAYAYAVSIAGTTAGTVPNLVNNPGFMAGARKRIAEIRAAFPSMDPDPMFNHGEGQTDRSDWGPLMRPAILEEEDMKLLPSNQALMQGRVREATGVVKSPLFDAELLANVAKDSQLAINHFMPGQGPYTIDGVTGRDWLAVVIGDEIGYIEEPLVVDRFVTDAGKRVAPASPSDPQAIAKAQQATADKANAQMDAWTATRPKIQP